LHTVDDILIYFRRAQGPSTGSYLILNRRSKSRETLPLITDYICSNLKPCYTYISLLKVFHKLSFLKICCVLNKHQYFVALITHVIDKLHLYSRTKIIHRWQRNKLYSLSIKAKTIIILIS
jgi:hypothetical protein